MAITNLNLASPRHILASLTRQRPDFNPRNAWVANTNPYIVDCIGKLRRELRAGAVARPQEIIDYIATSIGIHSYNCWTYLSAAINSYIEGDFSNAIHNAYYSELRAIMSFMATRGVGIFDGVNIIVDNNGNVHNALSPQYSELKTHPFAKISFDQWISDPSNTNEILSLISIDGHSLKGWFDATSFPPGSTLPGIVASRWLKEWSIDMGIIQGDKDFRNFVSYRPQNFDLSIVRHSDDIQFRLKYIIDIWELCSPQKLFSYSILRNAFEVLYKELFTYNNLAELDIEKDLKPILADLGKDPETHASSTTIKFLRREIGAITNRTFDHARLSPSNPIIESDTEPIGIISRACLLALITTNIAESMFRLAGITQTDLQFWYNHIGIKSGYWTPTAPPYLYSDLWDDILVELDEIKNWLGKTGVTHSPFTFRTDLKSFTNNIRHVNKTYLWSTAS